MFRAETWLETGFGLNAPIDILGSRIDRHKPIVENESYPLRPRCIGLADLHRICDHKTHRLGCAAVATHAMKARLVLETLAGGDDFLGIVIERRHHRASQHIPYARNRMRMTAAVPHRPGK